MSLLLGFDTGGTYTDAVLFDPARGVIASAKALTTKHDLIIGLRESAEAVLPNATLPIGLVSLSTTLATNAIVERHGSPICLILLGYPPDSLDKADLRRAIGDDPMEFVAGGHGPTGDEQAPLDLAAARTAIQRHAPAVAAFAVSGFFSVRNSAHELAVRALVRELTDRPVTCGHELTSRLDAPRRALTVALNARLIPQLHQLVGAVRKLLAEKNIRAPLMVVKGDGSLVGADVAIGSPVETILSGPAASVVGARHLSGADDVFVADMGGTTTDIAVLHGGRPVLDQDGATVGGWRTMVRAVAVHTFGLGGDSEVRHDAAEGLVVGPRRVVPLSLAAHQFPPMLAALRRQAEAEAAPWDGFFALRQRLPDTVEGSLNRSQLKIWRALADGPAPLESLLTGYAAERALERLVDRGLAVVAAFTPSDAAHLLGRQEGWSIEAAGLGAALWCRRLAKRTGTTPCDPDAFARRIFDQVVTQAGRALVATALAEVEKMVVHGPGSLGRLLVDRAVSGEPADRSLLGVTLSLRRPLVAIGAPAGLYYPAVAERLGTSLIVPPHAAVSNAVGAVAGGVMQAVTAVITAPSEGRFRVHLPTGIEDFAELDAAAAHASLQATAQAREKAERAGAADITVQLSRDDNVYRPPSGGEIFIESRITVTSFGRPKLALG